MNYLDIYSFEKAILENARPIDALSLFYLSTILLQERLTRSLSASFGNLYKFSTFSVV